MVEGIFWCLLYQFLGIRVVDLSVHHVPVVAQALNDVLRGGDPVLGVEIHLANDFWRHHIELLVLLL